MYSARPMRRGIATAQLVGDWSMAIFLPPASAWPAGSVVCCSIRVDLLQQYNLFLQQRSAQSPSWHPAHACLLLFRVYY